MASVPNNSHSSLYKCNGEVATVRSAVADENLTGHRRQFSIFFHAQNQDLAEAGVLYRDGGNEGIPYMRPQEVKSQIERDGFETILSMRQGHSEKEACKIVARNPSVWAPGSK